MIFQLLQKKQRAMLCALLILIQGSSLYAQQADRGVRFVRDISWLQILAQAKREQKYIFVDCYATWCGPCKMMDAEVYPDPKAGDYFNTRFVSLKLQMDETKTDDSTTRSWSNVAKLFATNYTIDAYPSFLFFSPDGEILHKHVGSGSVTDLISWARDAQDPEKQYYAILKNFQPGKLDTAELKGLALSLRYTDKKLSAAIALDYFQRTPVNNIYTPTGQILVDALQKEPGIADHVLAAIKAYQPEDYKDLAHRSLLIIFQHDPTVKEQVRSFVRFFTPGEFKNKDLLPLLATFRTDAQVQALVNHYLDTQPGNTLEEKGNVFLLIYFYPYIMHVHDRYYDLLYKEPSKIDRLCQKKDVSQQIIQSVLYSEIARPRLKEADSVKQEVDWTKMKRELLAVTDQNFTDRVWLEARTNYYANKVNTAIKAKDQANLVKYGNLWSTANVVYQNRFIIPHQTKVLKDTAKASRAMAVTTALAMNDKAFQVFNSSTNTEDLKAALQWIDFALRRGSELGLNYANMMDTKANLLYKLNRRAEAILWEQKAIKEAHPFHIETLDTSFKETLEKMQKDQPTWLQF